MKHPPSYICTRKWNNNVKPLAIRVNMNNLVSLMIVIIAFLSTFVTVAYVADVLACKFVEWLGMEGFDSE